jgi:hypothetical protein
MKIYLLAALFLMQTAYAGVLIKQRVDSKGKVLSVDAFKNVQRDVQQKIILKDIVEHIGERSPTDLNVRYQEILVPDQEFEQMGLAFSVMDLSNVEPIRNSEVRTIVNQGPTENRIDLTFVGDGYTLAEKEKFFADVDRMTRDMFEGQTFASYLPLFNVHAVFVPSQESGITDGVRKNTALGLYRDPVGSKRAIMPGNTAAIERAIALAPDSDYPILIANDDFYGGLGGRYAISTRSLESGTVVLRHELGHNFGNVGEEYDGGFVYSGANASTSGSNPSWRHWVQGSLNVYESRFLAGEYVWKNLSQGGYKSQFNFPGSGYIFDLIISSVGWETENDVEVYLNGVPKSISGLYTKDRSFFKFTNPENLSQGRHTLEFKEKVKDGDNVLAFAMIYAHPENINMSAGHIGAYATFDSNGTKRGYRPTFDACLMRDMRSVNFCSVDKENMWIRFFNAVGLIDKLSVQQDRRVVLETPDLGLLDIKWYGKKSGGDYQLLQGNQKSIQILDPAVRSIRAVVEFKTPEVRKPGVQFKTTKEIHL